MAGIELRNVSRSFGALRVLDRFSLVIEKGHTACLIGPSGCGKSTVLRIVAGLESPDGGVVSLAGRIVSGNGTYVAPSARCLGMAFQDVCLWPHMTVEAHLNLVLRAQRLRRAERRARIDELLEICRLQDKRRAYPGDLSGGQQQRVGFARAIACRPPILLLDEPFSNLDAALRDHLAAVLRTIQAETGTTILLATHDIEEARTLGTPVRMP